MNLSYYRKPGYTEARYTFTRQPRKSMIYVQLLDYISKNFGKNIFEIFKGAINRDPEYYKSGRKIKGHTILRAMKYAGLVEAKTLQGFGNTLFYCITEKGLDVLRNAV